jgi:hypothetical protein
MALEGTSFAQDASHTAQSPGRQSSAQQASTEVSAPEVSVVIEQYRNALADWFTPDELERLEAVDLNGTGGADARVLRFVAIDRAFRRFAPMALDAVVRSRDAERLRELLPITDDRSAASAVRNRVVVAALRRRERVAVASADEMARAMCARGAGPVEAAVATNDPGVDERTTAAERAVVLTADAAKSRDLDDVAQAALAAATAYGTDVDRAAVVDATFDLLRDLVAVGRGNHAADPSLADAQLALAVTDDPARAMTPHTRRHRGAGHGLRPFESTCLYEISCMPP